MQDSVCRELPEPRAFNVRCLFSLGWKALQSVLGDGRGVVGRDLGVRRAELDELGHGVQERAARRLVHGPEGLEEGADGVRLRRARQQRLAPASLSSLGQVPPFLATTNSATLSA